MKLSDSAQGVLYATAAYVWWGFLPLFWAIFDPVGNGWEVIAHRIFWTGVLLTVWIAIAVGWARFDDFVRTIRQSHRQTVLLLCAAVVSALNFWVNVAGVIAGHVVELGIGTFLTPLLTIALGIVFFRERPPLLTWIAIASALAGVAVMIVQFGHFPFYALMVSSTWAAYGALKKALMVDAVLSLAVETFLMMPLAVGYVAYLTVMGASSRACRVLCCNRRDGGCSSGGFYDRCHALVVERFGFYPVSGADSYRGARRFRLRRAVRSQGDTSAFLYLAWHRGLFGWPGSRT